MKMTQESVRSCFRNDLKVSQNLTSIFEEDGWFCLIFYKDIANGKYCYSYGFVKDVDFFIEQYFLNKRFELLSLKIFKECESFNFETEVASQQESKKERE